MLRAHWRSWIVLTVLVGLLGGVALAAASGARRTDTALRRFDAYSHTTGLNISPVFPGLASLPEVAAVDELVGEPCFGYCPTVASIRAFRSRPPASTVGTSTHLAGYQGRTPPFAGPR